MNPEPIEKILDFIYFRILGRDHRLVYCDSCDCYEFRELVKMEYLSQEIKEELR